MDEGPKTKDEKKASVVLSNKASGRPSSVVM